MEYQRPMIERTTYVADPVIGGGNRIGSGFIIGLPSPTWRAGDRDHHDRQTAR